jgi:AcrR family transcriptional regulator
MATTSHAPLSPERRHAHLARLKELMLADGFRNATLDDLAAQLRCSKSTLYRIAPSKEQLVIAVVKSFFGEAADGIESTVSHVDDPAQKIEAYLSGVGREMRRVSPAFYDDMTRFQPTAGIYEHNSRVAAQRVRELIAEGVERGSFRDVHAEFAGHIVALVISAIHRGDLLAATGMSSGDAYAELSELLVRGLTGSLPDRDTVTSVTQRAPRA